MNQWLNAPIARPDQVTQQYAEHYQTTLTKPCHALGQLESIAIQFAAWQGCNQPMLDKVHISIFAADHGIAEEQVSAFPQSVTAEMVRNFVQGGAAISVLANFLPAKLEIIDVGVKDLPSMSGIISQRVGNATANFCYKNAMTEMELSAAFLAGHAAAERARSSQLFIGGEMGIANTTSATAIACLLLDQAPQQLAGAGTGLDQAGIQHKIAILEQALSRCKIQHQSAQSILLAVGGFEIAALTGAYIRCAQLGIPILVDGFISSVAALLSVSIQKQTKKWMLFAHTSAEYGHKKILSALQANTLLNLDMRLGEGSGAALSYPLLRSACLLHSHMASFAQAGVSEASVPQE